MKKINKDYIVPLTLIICALILGGSYFGVQVAKQNSIGKQQQIERQEEKENKMFYDLCVKDAEEKYWDYMELNGIREKDGSINALVRFWDSAAKTKKENINNCVIRYLK